MQTYILELSIIWILQYAVFFCCMRKETFFKFNRWYLLTSVLMGLLLPLLKYAPSYQVLQLYNQQVSEYLPIVFVIRDTSSFVANNLVDQTVQWGQLFVKGLWLIYAIGCIFFLLRFVKGLKSIAELFYKGKKNKKDSYILINNPGDHLPFSFFKMLFVSSKMSQDEDYIRILNHELEHIKSWHSFDVIILEIINVIFWFHPMIYVYKSALRQTHEYLADAAVCGNGSRQHYGQLLLRQSLSGLEIAVAHHFFHSHIKKRINMIYQEKSGRQVWLKYTLALPILALLLLVFTSHDSIQSHVEKQKVTFHPSFVKSIYENFKVPKELMKDGVEGAMGVLIKVDSDNKLKSYKFNHVTDDRIAVAAQNSLENSKYLDVFENPEGVDASKNYSFTITISHNSETSNTLDSIINLVQYRDIAFFVDHFKLIFSIE